MNARAIRMLFVAAALSAFAAVLANTANAVVPEGAVVPAEIYAASASPVTSQQETSPTNGAFFVDQALFAGLAPAKVTGQKQAARALRYASRVRAKLGEIGAWAVPSISYQKPLLSKQTSVREKLGEIGAWAVPSISHQSQTPLAAHPTIPNVDPSTFEGYRG